MSATIETKLAPDPATADAHRERVRDSLTEDHPPADAQATVVLGDLDGGQSVDDAHTPLASVDLPPDHSSRDAHPAGVRGESVEDQTARDVQGHLVLDADADALLLVLSDTLTDMESVRIANQNRLRSLTGPKGLADDDEAVVRLRSLVEQLESMEAETVKTFERTMKKRHPLGPFVLRTAGIGLKQGGRLIATLGDPAVNQAEGRLRRGPAELWAYCGYVPGQKRRKGMKCNWSSEAKMRAFLVAESCVKAKATSRYGPVYDAAKTKYAEAVHDAPCAQCGPKGKPALEGSPLSKGHQHARALRVVAKEVLKDLFNESMRLHREEAA